MTNATDMLSLVTLLALGYALFLTRKVMAHLQAIKEYAEEARHRDVAIHDLPNGRGGVALEAIAAIEHDRDGINTWVHLKRDHGATLCLTWALGIALEQAWKAWSKG